LTRIDFYDGVSALNLYIYELCNNYILYTVRQNKMTGGYKFEWCECGAQKIVRKKNYKYCRACHRIYRAGE